MMRGAEWCGGGGGGQKLVYPPGGIQDHALPLNYVSLKPYHFPFNTKPYDTIHTTSSNFKPFIVSERDMVGDKRT